MILHFPFLCSCELFQKQEVTWHFSFNVSSSSNNFVLYSVPEFSLIESIMFQYFELIVFQYFCTGMCLGFLLLILLFFYGKFI